MGIETRSFRVHVHTPPSPASPYYEGHVDVSINTTSDMTDDDLRERVVSLAKGATSFRSLVVDRIERRDWQCP